MDTPQKTVQTIPIRVKKKLKLRLKQSRIASQTRVNRLVYMEIPSAEWKRLTRRRT